MPSLAKILRAVLQEKWGRSNQQTNNSQDLMKTDRNFSCVQSQMARGTAEDLMQLVTNLRGESKFELD